MSESQFDHTRSKSPEDSLEFVNVFFTSFVDAIKEAQFYFDTLVEFIESQEQKEVERLKGLAEAVPYNRKDEFWSHHYPCHWKEIFEGNLTASFIVSLLSALEFYLRGICQVLHEGKSKKLDDYRAKGRPSFCKKVRSYLSQYVSADLSSLDWGTIGKLWRIRNIIAHNQGLCLKESDKRLLNQFVDENDGISIDNDWIQIDQTFCKRVLQTVKKFGIDIGNLIKDDLRSRG